ncbi:hypothetical protein DSCO28_53070 [Desulfosarcina ovata subsp. sediminis]|uniref:Uncharacterized protein n=1 Tax=Desulfosarcina ovata subsp. sediminis TaxID=885957 RepID=A0A5K7ZX98_9BACT|nr:hypothetical protein DSCO28_53070 [Desulfosarcina ovata subsp. sediminis]
MIVDGHPVNSMPFEGQSNFGRIILKRMPRSPNQVLIEREKTGACDVHAACPGFESEAFIR